MSLLNPDLTNLEIKIDSVVINEREETLVHPEGEGTIESTGSVCVCVKANRNDIVFYADSNDPYMATNEYGLFRKMVNLVAALPIPLTGKFKCKTNGATGSFSFTNIKTGVNTLATIELDDSGEGDEGGEGGEGGDEGGES